jgi:putative flippase GtrA
MSWREDPSPVTPGGAGWNLRAYAMIPKAYLKASFPRAAAWVEPHFDLLRKAVSFGLIGVINAGVDFLVFLLARFCLTSSGSAVHSFETLSQWCACASSDTLVLIAANVMAWAVAVSGSYLMNSFITFAEESGRKLRWLDYGRFVASGILGVIANTTALVIASQAMPVVAAKGCAILAGFAVNFFMSHFVVFRAQREAPESAAGVVATD